MIHQPYTRAIADQNVGYCFFFNLIVVVVKLQSNAKVRKHYKKQKACVYADVVLVNCFSSISILVIEKLKLSHKNLE